MRERAQPAASRGLQWLTWRVSSNHHALVIGPHNRTLDPPIEGQPPGRPRHLREGSETPTSQAVIELSNFRVMDRRIRVRLLTFPENSDLLIDHDLGHELSAHCGDDAWTWLVGLRRSETSTLNGNERRSVF